MNLINNVELIGHRQANCRVIRCDTPRVVEKCWKIEEELLSVNLCRYLRSAHN
jgi:hypothetical protein